MSYDETDSPVYVFTATIEHPHGVVVTATARVPLAYAWPQVIETSELVQMGAATVMNRITLTKQQSDEEPPF